MAKPPAPRNSEVISKSGQFNPAHVRWWEGIRDKAYSAIQSFNEMIGLTEMTEAVDTANDYLLIYNASDSEAQRVPVDDLIGSAVPTLIESWPVEAVTAYTFDDIPADYRSLRLGFDQIVRSSGAQSIQIELSTDNGSSFVSAGIFGCYGYEVSGSSTFIFAGLAPSYIQGPYVKASETVSGVFDLHQYASDTSIHKSFSVSSNNTAGNTNLFCNGTVYGVGAINAIRLTVSVAFTATGTVRLYGIP